MELRKRGVEHVEYFVTDGLQGLKKVILQVFPKTHYQRCVLHMVRQSLNKVRVKDRVVIAEDLKRIYRDSNQVQAREALNKFHNKWNAIYPRVASAWQEAIEDLITFMNSLPKIRSYVYTTNVLERLIKEMKRRLKIMEMLKTPQSSERFLYFILEKVNEKYLNRKLKNWEFYFQIYLENRNQKSVHRCLKTQLT